MIMHFDVFSVSLSVLSHSGLFGRRDNVRKLDFGENFSPISGFGNGFVRWSGDV